MKWQKQSQSDTIWKNQSDIAGFEDAEEGSWAKGWRQTQGAGKGEDVDFQIFSQCL